MMEPIRGIVRHNNLQVVAIRWYCSFWSRLLMSPHEMLATYRSPKLLLSQRRV